MKAERVKIEPYKNERQMLLRELLASHAYSSQHDVVRAVRKRGFSVTQASISRDFRELGVAKVSGAYRALDSAAAPAEMPKAEVIRSVVLRVERAGPNLLVVRTQGGAAGIIAASLDKRKFKGVLGTIAGDDTVFVATDGSAAQKRVHSLLNQINTDWNG